MENRRYSKRIRLREYNVPVEDYIEAGDYSVSPVYKLPDHLFLKIFSYLPLRERCRTQRVCKFWQKLSREAWKSYNILTFSQEDWGCDLSFNFSINKYLVLENILQVCGPFITCLDLSRSRNFTVWKFISSINRDLSTIIGKHCPNLVVINLGDLKHNGAVRFLLESAKKLEEFIISYWSWRYANLHFSNNPCLRKLVIYSIFPKGCWNQLNPQTVEEIDTIFENIDNQFCIALKNWVKLKSIKVSTSRIFSTDGVTTSCIEAMCKSLMSVEESLKRIAIHCQCYYHCNRDLPKANINHNLINGFKNIEILELSGLYLYLSHEFFEAVGKTCYNLRRVHLQDLVAVDDVKMLHITELPKLEELKLANLETITDMIFTNNLFALKKLRCRNCPSLKAFGLCEFIQRSNTIESIEIMGCGNVDIEKVVSEAKLITESRTDNRPLRIIIE